MSDAHADLGDAVPEDYTDGEGWDEASGLDQCPACGRLYSGNGGYLGAVYTADGTRYEHVLDTDPEDGPFFCADCYDILDTNRKRQENRTLDEWGTT